MKHPGQIIGNVVLYAFMLYLLWGSTLKEWDPWFAFVVGFVIVLAILISAIPGLRATKGVSPGTYPYED